VHKLIVMLCLVFAGNCYAAATESELDAHVAHLTEQLRCLVCQNQSIAESQADLAMDLKREVREMLQAGKSDAEVRDFMVERYGDFVLYDPPMKNSTLLLWLGPFILFVAATGTFFWRLRRRSREPQVAPSDDAALAKARALLTDKDE